MTPRSVLVSGPNARWLTQPALGSPSCSLLPHWAPGMNEQVSPSNQPRRALLGDLVISKDQWASMRVSFFSLWEKKKNPKTVFSICVVSLNPHTSAKVVVHELSVLWRVHSQVWGKTANCSLTVTILKESSSLNTAGERGHYYTLTFDSHIKEAKIIKKQVLKKKNVLPCNWPLGRNEKLPLKVVCLHGSDSTIASWEFMVPQGSTLDRSQVSENCRHAAVAPHSWFICSINNYVRTSTICQVLG